MSQVQELDRADMADLSKAWWLPVVFGVFLMLYSFTVLSFSIRTVWAVSFGLGVGLIISGIAELALWRTATSWRWLVLASGVIDIGLGIAAFAWPQATFLVLARLVGWVLLIRGVISIVESFESRRLGDSGWWVLLLVGLLNIGIAFWATRYPGRSIVFLVLWVGLALMMRGLAAIAAGFALRSLGKEMQTA